MKAPPKKKGLVLARRPQQLLTPKQSVVAGKDTPTDARCKLILAKVERSLDRATECVLEARNNLERNESEFWWLNMATLLVNLTDLHNLRRRVRKLVPLVRRAFTQRKGCAE